MTAQRRCVEQKTQINGALRALKCKAILSREHTIFISDFNGCCRLLATRNSTTKVRRVMEMRLGVRFNGGPLALLIRIYARFKRQERHVSLCETANELLRSKTIYAFTFFVFASLGSFHGLSTTSCLGVSLPVNVWRVFVCVCAFGELQGIVNDRKSPLGPTCNVWPPIYLKFTFLLQKNKGALYTHLYLP